jgi:hypothetical protein
MKNSIFWDKTLCKPLKVNCFGGTRYLHLHGWLRTTEARNQHEAESLTLGLLLTLKMKVTSSSEMLANFEQNTQVYNQEETKFLYILTP